MSMLWEDLLEPPSRWDRWKATVRKQPSAVLLFAQISVILLLPFLVLEIVMVRRSRPSVAIPDHRPAATVESELDEH